MTSIAQTVLITGCTKGGIGYSLAKEFASRNYHVYAAARKVESMDDLDENPNITLLALDVTKRESVIEAHALISKENNGKLDIIYHNAGYRSLAMGIEITQSEAFKMMNTNFFGIVDMNSVFADLIIAAKGIIVFTSSVSQYTPHPSSSAYCASKAAMGIYAKTLKIEMMPFQVRVLIVETAAVNTGMSSARVEFVEDSYYKYLETKINQAWEDLESSTMSPDAYANTVVNNIVRKNPTFTLWAGTGAWQIRALEILNFQWLYPFVFGRWFGLNRLAPM